MAAREWVGTPHAHQHGLKGVRSDCVGLIRGVGGELGVMNNSREAWAPYLNYSRTPNPRKMGEAMKLFLDPIDNIELGCVVWMQWREGLPQHLGIIGLHEERWTLIHSNELTRGVVEHTLDDEWREKIASCWRYPGVEV
jgi:hypothetical protein